MEDVVLAALGAWNAFALALVAWDKAAARRAARRVPERVLLGLAALGGAAGVLLGMALARHKTRKPRFALGVPLLLALQLALAYALR